MNWEEFYCDIKTIAKYSHQIDDSWEIVEKNNGECGSYLRKKQFIELPKFSEDGASEGGEEEEIDLKCETGGSNNQLGQNERKEIVCFEYHILYHLSYAVPYICFNAYKSNGKLVNLTEAWQLFVDPIQSLLSRQSMASILTQSEHPLEFRPFLTLHPCRTQELLELLPNSQNKVLSFLSSIGPSIHLKLDLKYADLMSTATSSSQHNEIVNNSR